MPNPHSRPIHDTDHVQVKPDWMKCSEIEGYSKDQPRADEARFSLDDIRKAETAERMTCLKG